MVGCKSSIALVYPNLVRAEAVKQGKWEGKIYRPSYLLTELKLHIFMLESRTESDLCYELREGSSQKGPCAGAVSSFPKNTKPHDKHYF